MSKRHARRKPCWRHFGKCRDCHAERTVSVSEGRSAFAPRCLTCGGMLDISRRWVNAAPKKKTMGKAKRLKLAAKKRKAKLPYATKFKGPAIQADPTTAPF